MMLFNFRDEPFNDTISMRIAVRHADGKVDVARSVTFERLEPGTVSNTLFELGRDEAQNLADQLYAVGIRPSLAAGSAGQLDAVKYHLEDMRQLALKGMK